MQHQNEEHHVWYYVWFLYYLDKKDCTLASSYSVLFFWICAGTRLHLHLHHLHVSEATYQVGCLSQSFFVQVAWQTYFGCQISSFNVVGTDYSYLEQKVAEMVRNQDYTFLPSQKALALTQSNAAEDDEIMKRAEEVMEVLKNTPVTQLTKKTENDTAAATAQAQLSEKLQKFLTKMESAWPGLGGGGRSAGNIDDTSAKPGTRRRRPSMATPANDAYADGFMYHRKLTRRVCAATTCPAAVAAIDGIVSWALLHMFRLPGAWLGLGFLYVLFPLPCTFLLPLHRPQVSYPPGTRSSLNEVYISIYVYRIYSWGHAMAATYLGIFLRACTAQRHARFEFRFNFCIALTNVLVCMCCALRREASLPVSST